MAALDQIANAPRSVRRELVASGALVFGSTMVLSVGGFAFHAIASRKLGVADYGALYALISFFTLASMPAGLFGPVIAKYSAEFRALHDDSHLRGLLQFIARAFALIGAIYIVLTLLLAPQLAAYLKVSVWEVPVTGIMIAVALFSSALRSMGQGMHEFGGYSLSTAGEGVAKFVALWLLSIGGLTILRGTIGFLFGLAIGLVAIAVPLWKRFTGVTSVAIYLDWPRIWATAAGAASMTITMALIGSADVVLVKHFFNAEDAGLYSAASLGGKILLYFVGFVPAVVIPYATDRHARGERTRETIGLALVFIVLVGICGVGAYHFFGVLLLHALVGSAFDAASPLLVGYAAAMALLGATSALCSYGIATHRLAFAAPLLLGAIGTLAAIGFSHANLVTVVAELVAGNVCMLAFVAIALGWQGYRLRSDR